MAIEGETVLFSYRRNELGAGGNLADREQLFAMLEHESIQPLVTLGAEAAYHNPDGTVEAHRLTSETTTGPLAQVALTGVGAVVNRVGRSFKPELIPHFEHMPPTINENATRSLAFRKHRVYDEVMKPLDMGISTTLVDSLDQAHAFLDMHHDDVERFVIKPSNGTDSQGIQVVARHEVAGIFRQDPGLLGTQIMQPAFDFTRAFPAGMRAYDKLSQEAFEGWSKSNEVKELRMYGLHSPEQTATFPVARAMVEGEDHWFFVDPESVPRKLHEKTAQAMRLAAQVSGAAAMLGTVDYGYGSVADERPDWHAIELNGKAPYLIDSTKHAAVSTVLRQMFTDQIVETVRA